MSKAIKSSRVVKTCDRSNYGVTLAEAKKQAHVRGYLNSKKTQQSYCNDHNLSLSSLKSWVKKYRPQPMPQFLPVEPRDDKEKVDSSVRIEIYKGDCKIVVINPLNLEVVVCMLQCVL